MSPVESEFIFYKKGYKYQLSRELVFETGITGFDIKTDYIRLFPSGLMILAKGYAWDGATSFPDFDWIIYGSAAHDGGYQLLRKKLLPAHYRRNFDVLLGVHCLRHGAWGFVAAGVVEAVDRFAEGAISANSFNPELVSPKI